jgi:sortase (surface protein transpeptidase)
VKVLFWNSSSAHRGRQLLLRGVILAAVVAGVVLITVGLATQQTAPQAPAAHPAGKPSSATKSSATGSGSAPADRATTSSARQHTHKLGPKKTHQSGQRSRRAKHKSPQVLPASKPVRLKIPHINVDTAVGTVGRTSSNEIGAPKGNHINDAGWFDESPTPGQYGPSVIVGHIDTQHGPSVFFRLGELRHGNTIQITRKDDTNATFVVDTARRYPDRTKLPAGQLLGGHVDRSGLRLVTCTDYDHTTGHYRGNTIISAHLTHTHK